MTCPAPLTDVPLHQHNSFGIASTARWLLPLTDPSQFTEAVDLARLEARRQQRAITVLGGGSNVLLDEVIEGPILQVATRGLHFESLGNSDVLMHVEAGEPWHDVVTQSAAAGLWGIENLSLIPGTVGAAPVQNIGAYGSEISQCLAEVRAIDVRTAIEHTFAANQCAFDYRDSRFKREAGQWLITRVTLRLSRTGKARTDYPGVAAALIASGLASPDSASPAQVVNAIAEIRRRKLPDPAVIGNAGSFFKNPQVSTEIASQLSLDWPKLPTFAVERSEERKLSAAWMIEACGWKGHRQGAVGVSDQHALVLVNHGGGRARDLLALAADIIASVEQRFGVTLEREPVFINGSMP